MTYGKLYGVGVGPGDKELLTLKALRILQESDVIAVPAMKSGEKTAFSIVKDYIGNKPVIDCTMPMNKDFVRLKENYERIADIIENELKKGNKVAFITLGDPSVYSTYMQINSIIIKRGYETEIIPGITSFCAAAAKLNMSLCERDEPLVILPASYKDIKEGLKFKGNKVLMKANKEFSNVRDILIDEGLIDESIMIERCTMENEKIHKNLNDVDEDASYFSVIIVKDKK